MASSLKNLSEYDAENLPDISELTFGLVVSDYHKDITYELYAACYDKLVEHGGKEEEIHTLQVPGAFELIAGAKLLASRHTCDAVICLGCVIKGETPHNDYINNAVAQSLANMTAASGIPFIFGLLTPNTAEQAKDRAGGQHGNKGVEAAIAAIRMAAVRKEMTQSNKRIGY